ncbi:BMP family ABC transporter substrate-binding protein [Paenibacillus sp. N1-5-1-14]|uniref:BMP family lipoprotein n=1 Tax=Paenibacillus radicibacter TaxID=2972488 RepID=UPI00215997E4|nr:BMP family ABC transporter substrate-binding protein [Paenibacillus radicibacter]MCR8642618.1 BMP family ABC transporter substrate-binding protein [Paenibacillus radicibacter]
MKKFFNVSFLLVLAFSLALVGCGGKTAAPSTDKPAASEAPKSDNSGKDFKFGMVTDVGGVNDKSFNQSAWEALQQIKKETGAEVKYLESKSEADFASNTNQFVKGNYNLTWGIGMLLDKAVKDAATQNPNAKLAMIDNVVELPNVQSVTFAEQEGSYLVGIVAGMTTKTNKVGFVGGMKIPVISRFHAGFVAGVKAANPKAEVLINYAGDFGKPDVGKAAAASLYNSGADIIFHAAGGTGNGVFNEAKDRLKAGKKVWVIGVDKDQSIEFGADVTLTSMIKRVDQAVHKVTKEVIDGKFAGGTTTVLGLKDQGVGISDTSRKTLPADVVKAVDDAAAKIVSGEIKVPADVQ